MSSSYLITELNMIILQLTSERWFNTLDHWPLFPSTLSASRIREQSRGASQRINNRANVTRSLADKSITQYCRTCAEGKDVMYKHARIHRWRLGLVLHAHETKNAYPKLTTPYFVTCLIFAKYILFRYWYTSSKIICKMADLSTCDKCDTHL